MQDLLKIHNNLIKEGIEMKKRVGKQTYPNQNETRKVSSLVRKAIPKGVHLRLNSRRSSGN